MKKIGIVSIASLLFLFISSITAYLLRYSVIENPLFYLGFGLIPFIISVFVALISHKNIIGNIICLFLTSIGLGFFLRAWYVFRGFDNSIFVMLLVSIACVAYLWVFYLINFIPAVRKRFKLFFILFLIISLIGYVLLVAFTKTTYVSTFGFYAIVEIAFIFAMCKKTESINDLIRNITLSSYSVIVVAILILIMIVAEDGLDLDCGFDIDGVHLLEGVDFNIGNNKRKSKR